MNKHFLNEKGITLTELLAALSLFAVVSALVMTVLFNVFLNSENISDNAQLRQDANLLISTLRSHYNQGDFEVCLNDNNSLLIDGQEVNSSMTSSIDELELINGENSISTVNESMDVTADGTPLSIDLTLKNEAGQTYRIFTTIEKPAELEIALQVIEVPDPPNQPENWEIAGPGGVVSDFCEPRDIDTKYTYGDSNQFIPDDCTGPITIEANVSIAGDFPVGVDMKHNTAGFNVTKNLFVDSIFNIDNKHHVYVEGDAIFNKKLELKNEGELLVDQNIHATGGDHDDKGVVVGNYTRLEAKQSMVVAKHFQILSHGQAIIGKNLIIYGNLEMYNNAEITVKGNARIDGDLILGGNSNLTITGNLAIKGEVKQDDDGNNGTLHVGGITNFSKGKPSWLNVED